MKTPMKTTLTTVRQILFPMLATLEIACCLPSSTAGATIREKPQAHEPERSQTMADAIAKCAPNSPPLQARVTRLYVWSQANYEKLLKTEPNPLTVQLSKLKQTGTVDKPEYLPALVDTLAISQIQLSCYWHALKSEIPRDADIPVQKAMNKKECAVKVGQFLNEINHRAAEVNKENERLLSGCVHEGLEIPKADYKKNGCVDREFAILKNALEVASLSTFTDTQLAYIMDETQSLEQLNESDEKQSKALIKKLSQQQTAQTKQDSATAAKRTHTAF